MQFISDILARQCAPVREETDKRASEQPLKQRHPFGEMNDITVVLRILIDELVGLPETNFVLCLRRL